MSAAPANRRRNRLRSRGFTLVETLTVAAAVSVLLSLVVPAVQDARTSSRDATCYNRVKQLGLAVHNYHDVYNGFPPGWISKRGTGEGHPSNGWQTMILPFVDQAPLYNALNRDDVYLPTNKDLSILKTPLAAYRCTSDSIGDTNPLRGGWGTSNFSGNHGSHPIPRWSESDFWPGQTASNSLFNVNRSRSRQTVPNGVFEVNRMCRIRDILDGTSNTICIGERGVVGRGGIWPGPRSNFHETDVVSDLSYASGLNRSDSGYSSRHSGGIIYCGFCDGSVWRIHESVESLPATPQDPTPGILQRLASRNDGNTIGSSQHVLPGNF